MSNAALFLGCGGSGIETLMRLNTLLSQDPSWRHRSAYDVYYIIVDTETAKIDEFYEDYEIKFGRDPEDNVLVLPLSQGLTSLEPRVRRYFETPFLEVVDPDMVKARDRLYEHWWSQHGKPFTAPMVNNIQAGAGQCPPLSFFLSWTYLHRFKMEMKRFVDLIKTKRTSRRVPEPMENLHVSVITGLAGGTGRGCWAPLAFKLREIMDELGHQIDISGYFFDVTCFPDIINKFPKQKTQLRLNSLTGLSELSAWMRNIGDGAPLRYRLPSHQTPGTPSQDVLNTEKGMNQQNAAPVNKAFLVFGNSQNAALLNSKHYFQMVGSALYAKFNYAAIKGNQINEREPYRGLAALSFEVDATRLRIYFENLGRIHFVDRLEESNSTHVEETVKEFLDQAGLRMSIREMDDLTADAKGSLFNRVCHFLSEKNANEISRVLEEFNENYEEALDDLEAVVTPSKKMVKDAVEQAMDTLVFYKEQNLKDQYISSALKPDASSKDTKPGAELSNWTVRAFRGEEASRYRSIENALLFLNSLIRELENFGTGGAGMLSRRDVERELDRQWNAENPEDVEGSLNYFVNVRASREGRLLGMRTYVHGVRFSTEELGEIEDRAHAELLRMAYGMILEAIRERLDSLLSQARSYHERMVTFAESAKRLKAVLEEKMVEKMGATKGSTVSDLFHQLFADEAYPEKAIPAADDPVRFYRRVLKPVMRKGEESEILRESGALALNQEEKLDKVVTEYLATDYADSRRNSLLFSLERVVNLTVQLQSGFLERHFSLLPIAEKLQEVWIRRLNNLRGNDAELRVAKDMFSRFFGSEARESTGEYVAKPMPEFIEDMIVSGVVHNRPFIDLTAEARDILAAKGAPDYVSMVFVPPLIGDPLNKESIEDSIKKLTLDKAILGQVEIAHQGAREGERGSSPFSMFMYSSEGVDRLDHISLLDYWRGSDSDLYMSLKEAEDGTSGLVFRKGIGYVDPLYVSNEEIKALRWHPWLDEDENPKERNATLDTLLYALFIPGEEETTKFSAEGWEFPLIQESARRRYSYFRRAYMKTDEGYVVDRNTPWDAEENLPQNIANLHEYFSSEEQRVIRERILSELRLFWKDCAHWLGYGLGMKPFKPLLDPYLAKLDHRASNTKEEEQARLWKELYQRLESWRDDEKVLERIMG